jgi:hypothetical protein
MLVGLFSTHCESSPFLLFFPYPYRRHLHQDEVGEACVSVSGLQQHVLEAVQARDPQKNSHRGEAIRLQRTRCQLKKNIFVSDARSLSCKTFTVAIDIVLFAIVSLLFQYLQARLETRCSNLTCKY